MLYEVITDSKTSRFAPEGYQEDYVAFVKEVTSKPVAIVGRYTSPDTMVSAIRRGITVITSYSIHYTKLYDPRCNRQ